MSGYAYLVASVLVILALRGLSSPESARRGNLYGMAGMAIAIVTTLLAPGFPRNSLMLTIAAIAVGGVIGAVIARRIAMTSMPQLVAAFHSLVGLAAVLIAAAAVLSPEAFGITEMVDICKYSAGVLLSAEECNMPQWKLVIPVHASIEAGLGAIIGAITFSGSIIAFAKLQGIMSGAPMLFRMRHLLNAVLALLSLGLLAAFCVVMQREVSATAVGFFLVMTAAAFLLGFLLIIPIGGADMPVVVSMLNSYSGWAAAATGFTLGNPLLIIAGALIGASGAILSYIMCKAMNRSIVNVIFGGFGTEASAAAAGKAEERPVKSGSPEDASFLLKNASTVIIVPGYGMAVAQAQHAVQELAHVLEKEGVNVRYAIHPVAGRMPGHMNVLLAEANVPYDSVFELEDINRDFASCDVAYVIGANDVTNPAAKNDPKSPIFGMPILDVASAKTVIFVKRGMSAGYAGIENTLFYQDNTMMLFGDAKKVTEALVKALD